MGIYIFEWDLLRKYLLSDNKNPDTSHDFGQDILPSMLEDGKKMYAWPYKGYWKDVGTVKSFWEANMDILDENSTLNLYDKEWRIYTKSRNMPAHLITKKAKVKTSLINEGCIVNGTLNNSILFTNVMIEEGAVVNNSVVLADTVIKKNAVVNNAVVLEGTIIEENAVVGEEDNHIYLVSNDGVQKE